MPFREDLPSFSSDWMDALGFKPDHVFQHLWMLLEKLWQPLTFWSFSVYLWLSLFQCSHSAVCKFNPQIFRQWKVKVLYLRILFKVHTGKCKKYCYTSFLFAAKQSKRPRSEYKDAQNNGIFFSLILKKDFTFYCHGNHQCLGKMINPVIVVSMLQSWDRTCSQDVKVLLTS